MTDNVRELHAEHGLEKWIFEGSVDIRVPHAAPDEMDVSAILIDRTGAKHYPSPTLLRDGNDTKITFSGHYGAALVCIRTGDEHMHLRCDILRGGL